MQDKDLRVIIKCDCNFIHDWMAFSSWYSIRKKIPDAIVSLEVNISQPMFLWAKKFGLSVARNQIGDFKISPTVMAVRDFDGNLQIKSSKLDEQVTFIDYKDGCGNFVMDDWINTSKAPFFKALKRFGNANLNVNEMAILTLWEQCHNVYIYAGGS